MTAAIITASASIVVAVLAFLLSQRAQLLQERRQARLTRINAQLRELYGPLNTLVDMNEQIWEGLRATILPPREEREVGVGASEWARWRDSALMPTNRRMCDLIIEHADLIIESDVPRPLREFCSHVLSLEVVITEEAEGVSRRPLVAHPGDDFVGYVRNSFVQLKNQQQKLLGSTS
ncbi:hypothetical protein [Streptomyces sp. NRRL S-37]|uniref:hypothetical protein n=1 Tax=Streptomyces sp. NRRL S-37 TaxID=1463903 RepID=UPI0018FE4B2C|nr:hypothetical protein [Streptomyces sp. NRRL S-37]